MLGQRQHRVKPSVCVLASGGIDSSILVAHLAKRYTVYPLYLQSGLYWEEAERFWLKKFLRAIAHRFIRPLTTLQLPTYDLYGNVWSTNGKKVPDYASKDEAVYLPGRNLLLLTKAAAFASQHKIHLIASGILKGNPFPDARPAFFRSFERTAQLALNHKIKILTPFAKYYKRDLLQFAHHLPLHLAFSCLAPRGHTPCGRCNKCAERDKLLRLPA